MLDSLKISNLTNAASESYATGGKGNPRLMGWNFDRVATFDITDALMNPDAVAKVTGNALVTGAATIVWKELLTGIAGASTKTDFILTNVPITTAGSYSVFTTVNGTEMGPEVATGITIDGPGKKITVSTTDIAIGATAWIFYKYMSGVASTTMQVSSDKFPGYYKVVGDTVVRNQATQLDEQFQIVINNAKLMSNFDLTMQAQGDPSVLAFKLEVFKPSNSTQMIQMIKY